MNIIGVSQNLVQAAAHSKINDHYAAVDQTCQNMSKLVKTCQYMSDCYS